MKTALCQLLQVAMPEVQAPMEGRVGPGLEAAESNEGGFGTSNRRRADRNHR